MTFSSSVWNLGNIIQEARGITGRPDTSMISDAQMINIANFYYQQVLPKELKIFWGYCNFSFFTVAGQDQYTAPTNFQTLNPKVYADGFWMDWYLDPDAFYEDYPLQLNKVVVATGDGVTNSFTYQIPAFPIIQGSLYVTDGTQVAQDNGSGSFINPVNNTSLNGSINYQTGAVTGQSFANPPAASANITESSQTYQAARPNGILYYRQAVLGNSLQTTRDNVNMFVLRPVPDQVYQITMHGIQVPAPFVNTTDVPFRQDLGPLIALGMSLHIFKLYNQMDQYAQIMPEYNRFKDVCMQDTYEEYLYQRSIPKF